MAGWGYTLHSYCQAIKGYCHSIFPIAAQGHFCYTGCKEAVRNPSRPIVNLPMTTANAPSVTTLRQDLQAALQQWHEATILPTSLITLHLFRPFQAQNGGNARLALNEFLLMLLQALETENSKAARILRLRYLDNLTVYATANRLNLSESTLYPLQRQALDRLAALVYKKELLTRNNAQTTVEQRFEPPTYTQLIGAAEHLDQLVRQLNTPGPPWLIALEGMGGIGKTSLANALLRRMLNDAAFSDFGWVTARQENFDLGGGLSTLERPALTSEALVSRLVAQLTADDPLYTALAVSKQLAYLETRLKAQAHLIVIDNLETVIDITTLLPLLKRLSEPSKFVLTTREHFQAETTLFHFPVPELSEANAFQLIRQETQLGNLADLVAASDAELHPIYTTVGGNPLALRLVVGQTYGDSLPLILEDLTQARGAKAENLYTFIYQRAWARLDEMARRVWLCLPLLHDQQATASAVAEISEQPVVDVRAALDQLVRLNLVNRHGTLQERFYTIHNLTRSFLQEQVARWL